MNAAAVLRADQILNKLRLSDNECVLMFRSIVLLFELAEPDDDAFNLYHPGIKNYCRLTGLEIIPLNTVAEVNNLCKDEKALQKKYPSGYIIFSHSGRNQLRQMIRHMRNACSHAGLSIVASGGKEYIRFEAKDPSKNKTKLLALIRREQLEPFWNAVLKTLRFSSK
ncbi:MAG: hypothetical protein ISS66_20240 [Desulfobacteraceae bacterium]|nr:hypothetical protein [Desulfobacteraceae bacterium]